MASIKLILRTHQADQTGHSPLYIRIIKDRKTKFITAGVKLKENEWDEIKQKVKKNHPNSARMNASLSQKIADAEGQVADLERKVKTISIKKLKEAIKQEYLKCASDPIYFMKKFCYIQHPKRGKIRFELYPFQEDTLTELKHNRYNVILKSRTYSKKVRPIQGRPVM